MSEEYPKLNFADQPEQNVDAIEDEHFSHVATGFTRRYGIYSSNLSEHRFVSDGKDLPLTEATRNLFPVDFASYDMRKQSPENTEEGNKGTKKTKAVERIRVASLYFGKGTENEIRLFVKGSNISSDSDSDTLSNVRNALEALRLLDEHYVTEANLRKQEKNKTDRRRSAVATAISVSSIVGLMYLGLTRDADLGFDGNHYSLAKSAIGQGKVLVHTAEELQNGQLIEKVPAAGYDSGSLLTKSVTVEDGLRAIKLVLSDITSEGMSCVTIPLAGEIPEDSQIHAATNIDTDGSKDQPVVTVELRPHTKEVVGCVQDPVATSSGFSEPKPKIIFNITSDHIPER